MQEQCAAIVEPAKKIPLAGSYDVIVAGAGCAGVFAALAAAKHGAKTLLIERHGAIGGNVGPGMIFGCIDPFADASSVVPGGLQGLAQEFFARARALHGNLPATRPVYSNIFSHVASRMAAEFGVELMLSAYVSDPIVVDGIVRGVFVETKSGRVAVSAKVTIDDTGEADLAMRAGAPMIRHVSPEPDFYPIFKKCYVQSSYPNWNEVGLVFLVSGVAWTEYEAFIAARAPVPATGFPHVPPNGIADNLKSDEVLPVMKYPPNLLPLMRKAWKNGEYHFARELKTGTGLFWAPPEHAGCNAFMRIGQDGAEGGVIVYGDIDTDDWRQVSLCENELRRHAFETVTFMRKYVPGWESAFLLFTVPFAGARGGACINGEYLLTPADILHGTRHEDAVLRICFEGKTWKKLYEHPAATEFTRGGYDMPYRMMIPKGLDGLLVTGRGSSYIRRGHDPSARARIAQFHFGQAAGTAAAFCVRDGLTVRTCNIRKLQDELVKEGFMLK